MFCAKNIAILGHTYTGMGEKTLALKYKRALEQAGCRVEPIIDIIGWMGSAYEPWARLNYDLAEAGHEMIVSHSALSLPHAVDLLLILSWHFSLAALYATGIYNRQPTVAALYVHHPEERVIPKLYTPATLLIAESLLAYEKAMQYDIPVEQLLYIPHVYPSDPIPSSRAYVEQLAAQQGKSVDPETRVIGCVGRLEYGKNYEFALEAVRTLVEKKRKVMLVLKGNFPLDSPYPGYQRLFSQMLDCYVREPWFLWDRSHTPYPDVLHEYTSFDLLLHPSGAEGGSHVVVECLGLKKPVVVLRCSTNPYLFSGVAHFVRTTGVLREAQLPFYIPDLEDLCRVLDQELSPPDYARVEDRFHESQLLDRLPLLFQRDPTRLQKLYEKDRKTYMLC